MSVKYVKIAAAVSAVLAANSAFAVDEAFTILAESRGNVLAVAGASAGRDSFLAVLLSANGPCVANTVDVYRAFPTGNQDFLAYSCQLKPVAQAPQLGTIAGQDAVVYYRAEGGSAWGPVSLIPNNTVNTPAGSIKRLYVTAACVTTTELTSGRPTHDCPVTGYSLANDTVNPGSLLVNDLTDLAVSDVEPKMFTDSNYPWGNVFLPFSPTQATALNGFTYETGYNQVFGVIVNTGGATATVLNLTKQDLAAIFSGAYSDWSQVPRQDNVTTFPAGQIIVCRREPGSGTQIIAAAKFLNTNCGDSRPFVTDTSPGTSDGVVQAHSPGLLEFCVASNPGAIGVNVFKSPAPATTRYVSINGIAPNKITAALGQYPIWNELTFTKRPGLSSSRPRANILANSLIDRSQFATAVPDTASTFAIPSASNLPQVPVSLADPVGLGTTNGKTCISQAGI